jgi:hypothetical protein
MGDFDRHWLHAEAVCPLEGQGQSAAREARARPLQIRRGGPLPALRRMLNLLRSLTRCATSDKAMRASPAVPEISALPPGRGDMRDAISAGDDPDHIQRIGGRPKRQTARLYGPFLSLSCFPVEDRTGFGPFDSVGLLSTNAVDGAPLANDSSGPPLINGRSQTAKSGFVVDTETAISDCIRIIGRRAASRSDHAPKRPPGFA